MTKSVFFFTIKADVANSVKDFTTSASFSGRIASNKKSRHSETPEGLHYVGLLIDSPVNTHRHAIYLVVRIISGLFKKRLRTFCHPQVTVTAVSQIAMQFWHLFIFQLLWTFNLSVEEDGCVCLKDDGLRSKKAATILGEANMQLQSSHRQLVAVKLEIRKLEKNILTSVKNMLSRSIQHCEPVSRWCRDNVDATRCRPCSLICQES
jgi:hypothetical protein